ncbi:helix-turn-helix transcriptional regulator [Streptomyces sp. KM273126]|uniref:AraC family transcriptional regulator n=1 Tax=Streptomyces sp. KM273126 TaxID=2545247 RepID=UPI00103A080F|nr:AraC family transcriptional regulator [Streptomyces sp. KM273126]MBA2813285.1 helix-turn-helix transcriptional regulator [Streptomyces sp. KM273126]
MPDRKASAWKVPLTHPPLIADLGIGLHGVDSPVDDWCLPDLWSLHLYGYVGELEVCGAAMAIAPGLVSLVPPGVATRYRYRGKSRHFFAHIRLPGLPDEDSPELPVMLDCGADLHRVQERFQTALEARTRFPQLAQAELWSLLHYLAARQASRYNEASGLHPAIRSALAHIEAHLTEPISVASLATEVGVSHNHLTRLFRAQLGTTVVAHMRKRRMNRAHHLLTRTALPVKTIAPMVGFRDLQTFNKAFRKVYGIAPRFARDHVVSQTSNQDDTRTTRLHNAVTDL